MTKTLRTVLPKEKGLLFLTLQVALVGFLFSPNKLYVAIASLFVFLGLVLRESIKAFLKGKGILYLNLFILSLTTLLSIVLIFKEPRTIPIIIGLMLILAGDIFFFFKHLTRAFKVRLFDSLSLLLVLFLFLTIGEVKTTTALQLLWGFAFYLLFSVFLVNLHNRLKKGQRASRTHIILLWFLATFISFEVFPMPIFFFFFTFTLIKGGYELFLMPVTKNVHQLRRLGWIEAVFSIAFVFGWYGTYVLFRGC